jgi:hypothetical protein
MRGDHVRAVQRLDCPGGQPHRQPPAGVACGDGVIVLPDADPGPAIDACLQQAGRVEHLRRQRQHGRLLGSERRRHGDRAAGDHPAVIEEVRGGDPLVLRGQRRHRRHGHG